jgi:hypothetical protein
MFYIEAIKRLSENIKNNSEIPEEEKKKAANLLGELARLLAMY